MIIIWFFYKKSCNVDMFFFIWKNPFQQMSIFFKILYWKIYEKVKKKENSFMLVN